MSPLPVYLLDLLLGRPERPQLPRWVGSGREHGACVYAISRHREVGSYELKNKESQCLAWIAAPGKEPTHVPLSSQDWERPTACAPATPANYSCSFYRCWNL